MPESIKIRGVPQLQRALFKLNADLGAQLGNKAIRKGATHFKNKLKEATPVSEPQENKRGTSGLAKKTLRVYRSKIHSHKKDGLISYWVGWPRGTGRRLLKGKAPKAVAFYIGWVEYGYNSNSKRAGVKAAETLGLLAKGTAAARKAQGLRNRRTGFRQSRIAVRYGGKHVPGQFFVKKTLDRTAHASIDIIVQTSNQLITQKAKELGFK